MYPALISVQTLFEHLDDPYWVVLDVRHNLLKPEEGQRLFEQGHIPGAQFADLDHDLSGPIIKGKTGRHPLPNPFVLAEKISTWGIGEGIQVVVYDAFGGAFAARAWWLLHWLGHPKVAVLEGGWPAWLEAGLPTTPIVQAKNRRPFVVRRLCTEMVAGIVDVWAAADEGRLLDARTFDRYCGENEIIDPVAGHIPGAISYPFINSFDSNKSDSVKYFKATPTLKKELQHYNHPVCYCGSGVTAAHLALSFVYAGFPMPQIYPGSWSEWITDPDRGVQTGPQP
ncbi:MAG TPA: sulfurtransferase [Bacteroidetes bacterium]|nr:sulfurtransferase [Bacteroidota bacterium]HRR07815.1 sulfurtransferase [Rhodothermales bacterium]